MRHHNNVRKFGRNRAQRKSLLKSLVRSLLIHGRIETTLAKAKELRPFTEKLITRAKKNDLASYRVLLSKLYNSKKMTDKLFKEIAPNYKSRKGGYTRITKLPRRLSDGSEMAVIEFV